MPPMSNQAASTLVYTFPVVFFVSTPAGIRISDTQGRGSPLPGSIMVGDRRKVLEQYGFHGRRLQRLWQIITISRGRI